MKDTEKETKKSKKELFAEKLKQTVRIARFNGTVIISVQGRWYDMTSELFARTCYEVFGSSLLRSFIVDLEHFFRNTAEDLSDRSHLISFGDRVWNTKSVAYDHTVPGEDCIYGVRYIPKTPETKIQFIMDLACGDEYVYDDIMQSVAPLLLNRKPTGVIWYLGNGSNGKSSLVHLLYMIFGDYLTEVTVKQLEDERDAPQLNGKLGNICKESSEALIKDTRTYKSIGTHESFLVHRFHSQEMTSVNGNVHHIFSANNIPTFSDKSDGAKRRTLIIPFNNRFASDEGFEERTFTNDFIELFLGEMVKYAEIIKQNNYSYKFSETSRAVKEQYDLDSNTSATYADELISERLLAFTNFRHLFIDYENWCLDNGYKASSVNVLRRTMRDKGFGSRSRRLGQTIDRIYVYKENDHNFMENVQDRPGMLRLEKKKPTVEAKERML
jgi:P4 family phage/plasmid primase-like protien